MAQVQGGEALDVYDHAYLAGGEQRVVESAITALVERGTLSPGAGRLRIVDAERPTHPVERAVIAACPRSKRIEEVFEDLRHREELDTLAHRLVDLGLVRHRRRRPTRAGRRRLAAAASEGTLPAYVLEGTTALAPGPVRAAPTPSPTASAAPCAAWAKPSKATRTTPRAATAAEETAEAAGTEGRPDGLRRPPRRAGDAYGRSEPQFVTATRLVRQHLVQPHAVVVGQLDITAVVRSRTAPGRRRRAAGTEGGGP